VLYNQLLGGRVTEPLIFCRAYCVNQEQMIGNAVPVNLAKFIAEAIKSYIETTIIKEAVSSKKEIA